MTLPIAIVPSFAAHSPNALEHCTTKPPSPAMTRRQTS